MRGPRSHVANVDGNVNVAEVFPFSFTFSRWFCIITTLTGATLNPLHDIIPCLIVTNALWYTRFSHNLAEEFKLWGRWLGNGVAERLSGWDNLGHVPRIDTANSTKELI